MNLQESIRRILREETNYNLFFRRFKDFNRVKQLVNFQLLNYSPSGKEFDKYKKDIIIGVRQIIEDVMGKKGFIKLDYDGNVNWDYLVKLREEIDGYIDENYSEIIKNYFDKWYTVKKR